MPTVSSDKPLKRYSRKLDGKQTGQCRPSGPNNCSPAAERAKDSIISLYHELSRGMQPAVARNLAAGLVEAFKVAATTTGP